MATLSLYTFVQNGLFMDYHVVAMLRHHLPFADEIIVNEGYSSDGTYEAICNIDPRIRVFRSEWDRSDPYTWHIKFKNRAKAECTGDWCIMLDCDEFIPEWEFARLRETLDSTDKDMLPVRFCHFYGNYRVYKARNDVIKHTPVLGTRIHRNIDNIEIWGDGANVKYKGRDYIPPLADDAFECHHFGEVRHAARLRQKWRTQSRQHNKARPRWDWMPRFAFNLFPHQWQDPGILGDLDIYSGPLLKAVKDDPDEFVRDGFEIYKLLSGSITIPPKIKVKVK